MKSSSGQNAAIRATIALLLGLAGSGFFWLPNGAAEGWPVYLVTLLLPWYLPRSPHYGAPRGASVLVLILLGWMTLSATWSDVTLGERASGVATGALLLAWMGALDYLSSHRTFWLWAWTVLVVAELGALVAALVALALGDLTLPGGRLVGLMRMSNPAVAGALWGQGTVLAAVLAWQVPRARIAYGIAACALLIATLATELRGALLGFAAAATGLGLSTRDGRLAASVAAGAAVIAGVAALLVFTPDAAHPRALGSNPRWDIWQTTLAGLDGLDWWFGRGSTVDQRVFLADGRIFDHAHSIVLATLAHTGLIGAALLVAVLGAALIGCLRAPGREAQLALAALAYIAGAGLVDGGLPFVRIDHSWLLLWLPIAGALAACPNGGKAVPSQPGSAG